jgi:hypothetical protein
MGTVTVRYGGHAWIIPNGEDLNPRIEVLGGQGNVLFPPPFPPPVIDDVIRKSAPPGPLLHDQVIRAHMPIIMRGSHVRAAFDFSVQFNGHTVPMEVQTPAVHVRLVPGRAPAVVEQTEGTVSARVRPAGPEDRGPLYHDGWYACPLPGGGKWYGGSSWYEQISTSPNGLSIIIGTPYGWKPTHSHLLKPGCAQPIEWHVVAGWLGQPAVAVDFP